MRLSILRPLSCLPIGGQVEEFSQGRIPLEEVVESDDVWSVSGVVFSAAEKLPITVPARHQEDGPTLVEDVRADERRELGHVPRLPAAST